VSRVTITPLAARSERTHLHHPTERGPPGNGQSLVDSGTKGPGRGRREAKQRRSVQECAVPRMFRVGLLLPGRTPWEGPSAVALERTATSVSSRIRRTTSRKHAISSARPLRKGGLIDQLAEAGFLFGRTPRGLPARRPRRAPPFPVRIPAVRTRSRLRRRSHGENRSGPSPPSDHSRYNSPRAGVLPPPTRGTSPGKVTRTSDISVRISPCHSPSPGVFRRHGFQGSIHPNLNAKKPIESITPFRIDGSGRRARGPSIARNKFRKPPRATTGRGCTFLLSHRGVAIPWNST